MQNVYCLLFGEQKFCQLFREFLILKENYSREDDEKFLYYTREFILDGISNFVLFMWDISLDQTSNYFDQTKNYNEPAKLFIQKKTGFYTTIILFTNAKEAITILRDLNYYYNMYSVLIIFNYGIEDSKEYLDEMIALLVWIKKNDEDESEEEFVHYSYNFLFFDREKNDSTSIGKALALKSMGHRFTKAFSRYPFEELRNYFDFTTAITYLKEDVITILSEESKRQLDKLN